MVDSGVTLGDILQQAINVTKAKEPKMFQFDVKLKAYSTHRKISDIKALRGATVSPVAGEGSPNMSLTDAKNAIEYMYDNGTVTIRMTAEQYAVFSYNIRTLRDYNWGVDQVSIYQPETKPVVFTF